MKTLTKLETATRLRANKLSKSDSTPTISYDVPLRQRRRNLYISIPQKKSG